MAVDYTPSFDPADVNSDYGSTGGDITVPTFKANMKPFRFWCQRALPLVYDDSLSYYEVLCKVVDQMNGFLTDLQTATGSIGEFAQQFVVNQQFLNNMATKLGQDVDTLETYINDRMDDFTAAYQQLQSYVNNYFDNLDVQVEINNKLDAMAADGTFNTLFNPVITAWMTEKTAQIDEDLAEQNETLAEQNGRISVLEGRMDTFSSLPSGSTSGNAELLDIRTNFLGETYPSAGDAVRASDMISSGFRTRATVADTPDWAGDTSSSLYYTATFNISNLKGAKFVCIYNTLADNVGTGGRPTIFGGNSVTPDANAVDVTNLLAYNFEYTLLKNYHDTNPNATGYRYMAAFDIPSDAPYNYLYFVYTPLFGSDDTPGAIEYFDSPNLIAYFTMWSKTPIDPTLTQPNEAADAKAAGDAISSLNERMDTYVSLTGENEVEPQNIAGVTFTRTEVETEGDNIFTSDMLFEENYYVAVNPNVNPPVIFHTSVHGYKTYCIPVEPNTTYHFPRARFSCTAKGNTIGSVATSETGSYKSTITTADETAYLFITYATDVEDMYVKPVEISYNYTNFEMPDWMTGTLEQIANDTTKVVDVETDDTNIEPDLTFTTGYMSKAGVVVTSGVTTLEYSNKIEVAPSNIIRAASTSSFRFICAFNGNTAVEAKGAENVLEYVVPDGIDHVVLTRYKVDDGYPIYLVETEQHYVNIVKPIPMGYMSEAGSLSDGDRLVLPYHNVKNKNRYVFNGNITSFTSIKFQKGTLEYITVSASNVVIHNDQGEKTVNYPSGFTIDHDVTILIENEESIYLSKLTIESAGHVFDVDVTTTPVRFLMDTSVPVIESVGSTMTNCRFSWVSENINQPIWIFGDSYASWYNARWVNYAVQDGYLKSSLLNGYAGEASSEAMNGLKNLLVVTTPKIVVWCLGMNNGDSDSAVNASWLSNYNTLIELSEKYDFEVVLYTTPTTPTINNNFKNAIVRDSGYRYVDADGAVRIDSEGHWVGYNTNYPALSNDNVHPTEIGAKILYYRFLADLPEMMSR